MNAAFILRFIWCLALGGGMLLPALAQITGISPGRFTLSSPDFAANQPLPIWCGAEEKNISPALAITGIPPGTKSLALVVEDPDAPNGLVTHWVMWDLAPDTTVIPEGISPAGAQQGTNTMGDTHFDGPRPPSGTHRYFFRLYALNSLLALPPGADRAALLAALPGHVIGKAVLMGTYSANE